MGKSVVFDGAPDGRCDRGKLVGGEINCRHGVGIASPRQPDRSLRGEPQRQVIRRGASVRLNSTRAMNSSLCRSRPAADDLALAASVIDIAPGDYAGVASSAIDASSLANRLAQRLLRLARVASKAPCRTRLRGQPARAASSALART